VLDGLHAERIRFSSASYECHPRRVPTQLPLWSTADAGWRS